MNNVLATGTILLAMLSANNAQANIPDLSGQDEKLIPVSSQVDNTARQAITQLNNQQKTIITGADNCIYTAYKPTNYQSVNNDYVVRKCPQAKTNAKVYKLPANTLQAGLSVEQAVDAGCNFAAGCTHDTWCCASTDEGCMGTCHGPCTCPSN